MKIKRHRTKVIKIGSLCIGGDNPIAIQSMAKTKTADTERTIHQIKELEKVGCEIVRLAIKDKEDALGLKDIKPNIKIPIVADIHFDWRLAVEAIDNGIDKIRLNPGNIYKKNEIQEIVSAAKANHVPIRIGVNSGSLKTQDPRRKTQDSMVKSVLDYIKILEGFKFDDIVVSLKASNVLDTIEAYRKMIKLCDYPLHLGVTATGTAHLGTIKSSIALGSLLLEGIGDTFRVSLTDKPIEEVKIAKYILEAIGLRNFGPEVISCPTCGRCEVDLVKIVKDLESRFQVPGFRSGALPLKVAIMGCVVNGPGEAKEADLGIAFGKKEGLLFKNGKAAKKVSSSDCIDILLKEMEKAND